MKILHTADWHLGQSFLNRSRETEHEIVLDQIIEIIESEKIEAIILAGDVFDTGSPNAGAQRLYYEFWKKLHHTTCRHAVVIGGNHDSPSVLNAPKEILQLLNIQVVGAVERLENGEINFENEILLLKNTQGATEAIVAAVPYLRERDLKTSASAESTSERQEAIVKGIKNHYSQIAEKIKPYQTLEIPILATGHLFAAGLEIDKQDGELDIHMGNLGKVGAEVFDDIFSYVALGHIHKPQIIGKKRHIRYAGSPLPLSFSERQDRKIVLILEYEKGVLENIVEKDLAPPRKLRRWEGTWQTVVEALEAFDDQAEKLTCWAEVKVQTDQVIFDLEEKISKAIGTKKIEALKIVVQQTQESNPHPIPEINLEYLNPIEVFRQKISTVAPEEQQALLDAFQELYESLQEND